MEITTALEFIKTIFGPIIGKSLTLIVSLFVIYGFLIKTGVTEHISLIANYKRRRKDKLIASKEVLIKESRLDEMTKANVIYHQNVLFLQIDLGTEEKDLNKLKYLNGFINKEKAIETYELCKDILIYSNIDSRLNINKKQNFKNANRNRIIGSIIYFIISLVSYGLMILSFHYFKSYELNTTQLIYVLIFSTAILGFGIYIAFQILSYFMKLKYAEWLFKMERIE